jgi:hypothetical protein
MQFHIDGIHRLRLVARVRACPSLLPVLVELPAPPVIMDTGQPMPAPTPGGQPLTWMVTISDAVPFCMLFSRDAGVSPMSL